MSTLINNKKMKPLKTAPLRRPAFCCALYFSIVYSATISLHLFISKAKNIRLNLGILFIIVHILTFISYAFWRSKVCASLGDPVGKDSYELNLAEEAAEIKKKYE